MRAVGTSVVIATLLSVSLPGRGEGEDRSESSASTDIPKLSRWDLPRVHAPGLASNYVQAIHEDTEGRLWFGTGNLIGGG